MIDANWPIRGLETNFTHCPGLLNARTIWPAKLFDSIIVWLYFFASYADLRIVDLNSCIQWKNSSKIFSTSFERIRNSERFRSEEEKERMPFNGKLPHIPNKGLSRGVELWSLILPVLSVIWTRIVSSHYNENMLKLGSDVWDEWKGTRFLKTKKNNIHHFF